jgi:hypothetical protein
MIYRYLLNILPGSWKKYMQNKKKDLTILMLSQHRNNSNPFRCIPLVMV